jgi:alginate O-acetyltransferase complex protein AlgI
MQWLGQPQLTWSRLNETLPISPFDLANTLLDSLGMSVMPWQQVLLPIGISFFTFHKISYVVDVYRGQAEPTRTFGECLLYLILFPQLIAGPIIRYHDIDQQIRSRPYTLAMFWHGMERFAVGLAKKLLLANAMAEICDPIFAADPGFVPPFYAWLAAVTYYFQIYFDFSGYSDMAIGLGRMMGFEFRENFDRPYVSTTFTEFWRRWHISLSNFMREYVYIPLGGNRVGRLRGYLNLWIVFLLSGFWHGASWNFIAWGAYQGVFLTADRLGWAAVAERLPKLPLRVSMVFLVTVSWVVFRANDMTHATTLLDRMFCGGGPPWYEFWYSIEAQLDGYARAMLIAAALGAFLPWSRRFLALEQRFLAWRSTPSGAPIGVALVVLLLLLSCLKVVNSAHNPFIYFRF